MNRLSATLLTATFLVTALASAPFGTASNPNPTPPHGTLDPFAGRGLGRAIRSLAAAKQDGAK